MSLMSVGMNFLDNQKSDRETYFNNLEQPQADLTSAEYNEIEAQTAEEVQNEHIDSLFVEWLAPSVHHHHVDHRWRAGVIILLLAMAGLMIFWQESFLGAIMFIGLALVASMHFHKEPGHLEARIHPAGVSFGDMDIPYHDIESFWIHYHPGYLKELVITCRNKFHQHVKIPLADQDPVKIRAKLLRYVPEVPHEETFADVLGRKLGL